MKNTAIKVRLCGAIFNKICYMSWYLNFSRRKGSKKRAGKGKMSVRKD